MADKTETPDRELHNQPHYTPHLAPSALDFPRAAADPSTRIRFGNEPHQALDLAVAELLLTRLCAEQPTLFARTLGTVMVGEDAATGAARAPRSPR